MLILIKSKKGCVITSSNNNSKSKILSVVIPTYNIEKYIVKCLDSFLNDKLMDMIDIIVVNDGSFDNSSLLAKDFEKKYPNSFKVIDKVNGGHGSTINTALKYAIGKYFMVVDGDDWVDSKSLLEILAKLNKMEEYDAVYFNYITEVQYNNSKIYNSLNTIFSNNGEVDFNNSKLSIINQIGLANTIYKTSNIKNKDYKLLEKTYYVDAEYMLFPLETIKKAYYFDKIVYHYLVGRANQSININTALKHIDDRKKIIYDVVNRSNINNNKSLSSFHIKFYNSKLSSIINDYFDIVIRGNHNIKDNIKNMDLFIKDNDNYLYNYFSENYKYIKFIRLFNYSIIVSRITYKIDRFTKTIIKYLKRSGKNA